MSNIAEAEHHRNIQTGRFNACHGELPHHGYLLAHKLRESIKLVQIRRQKLEQAQAEARRLLDEEILANPLHDERADMFAESDVQSRVTIGQRKAYRCLCTVYLCLKRHIEPAAVPEQLDELSEAAYQRIMAEALHRINHYYNKSTKATVQEFQDTVNAVLNEQGFASVTFRPDIIEKEDQQASVPMPLWIPVGELTCNDIGFATINWDAAVANALSA